MTILSCNCTTWSSILLDGWSKGVHWGSEPWFLKSWFHLTSEGGYGDTTSFYITPPWSDHWEILTQCFWHPGLIFQLHRELINMVTEEFTHVKLTHFRIYIASAHCQYQTCWMSPVLHVGAAIGVILPCYGRIEPSSRRSTFVRIDWHLNGRLKAA